MKVILKKEAEFDFNEEKYTAIPSEVFKTLVGETEKVEKTNLPRVIIFDSKKDYITKAESYNIDYDRSIYVSNKGQIFCFLKNENGTTDTEEDKE